jgi:hypothetical protein
MRDSRFYYCLGGGGMSEDGWNKVVTTGRPARYMVDTTKLKAAKEEGIVLGPTFQYSNWSGGANTKGKDANKRSMTMGSGPAYSPNIYAALDTTNEDGKRSPPPSSSRYTTIVDSISNYTWHAV